jgi:hypothetical protein
MFVIKSETDSFVRETTHLAPNTKVSVEKDRQFIGCLTGIIFGFQQWENQLCFVPELIIKIVGFRHLRQCRRNAGKNCDQEKK